MAQKECPFCKGWYVDLLQHLVLTHEIEDAEHFLDEVREGDEASRKAIEYRAYLDQQRTLQESGAITPEEFRRRMSLWTPSPAGE